MRKRWPQKLNPLYLAIRELTPEGSRPVVSVAWPCETGSTPMIEEPL